MWKFSKILTEIGGKVAALTLAIGIASVGIHCMFFFHQPKIPQGMSKFVRK